jgi:hypothetical protein
MEDREGLAAERFRIMARGVALGLGLGVTIRVGHGLVLNPIQERVYNPFMRFMDK